MSFFLFVLVVLLFTSACNLNRSSPGVQSFVLRKNLIALFILINRPY